LRVKEFRTEDEIMEEMPKEIHDIYRCYLLLLHRCHRFVTVVLSQSNLL